MLQPPLVIFRFRDGPTLVIADGLRCLMLMAVAALEDSAGAWWLESAGVGWTTCAGLGDMALRPRTDRSLCRVFDEMYTLVTGQSAQLQLGPGDHDDGLDGSGLP